MNKIKKDFLILFLSLIIGFFFVTYMNNAYALDEFQDDYWNETYVQVKNNIVRNSDFNCMELEESEVTWLTGWNNRKQHQIKGSTVGNTNNHVVPFRIYKGVGVDGTEAYRDLTYSKMYCGGSSQDDFDDIRFTTVDGETELIYWKEVYTSGVSGDFWVKIPLFTQSVNYTLYVYYNNSLATDNGDIKNTFRIGDDFEDDVFDTSIWTEGGTGTLSETGGELRITGTSGYKSITSNLNISLDGSVYIKTNLKRTGNGHTYIMWYNTTHPLGSQTIQMLMQPSTNIRHKIIRDGTLRSDTQIRQYTANIYYDVIFNWRVGIASKIWVGGISNNYAVVGNLPRDCDKWLGIGDYQDTGITHLKFAFVKMRTNPEPTPQKWGNEEISEGLGYYNNGYFYTVEIVSVIGGNTIVLLTNTTIPYSDIITVEFSNDNNTWLDHNGNVGFDTLVAGNESIDLRDLSYTNLYSRFNFTDGGIDSTPRLYQIRVITSASVGNGNGNGETIYVYNNENWILLLFIVAVAIALIIGVKKK